MPKAYRSQLEIDVAVLESCVGGKNKTGIMRLANLDFSRANSYINRLQDEGFIHESNGIYLTTIEGKAQIVRARRLQGEYNEHEEPGDTREVLQVFNLVTELRRRLYEDPEKLQRQQRTKEEMVGDALRVISAKGEATRFEILRGARLSWTVINKYLSIISDCGLVTLTNKKYSLTEKGNAFLETYNKYYPSFFEKYGEFFKARERLIKMIEREAEF